jgi:hypothetical protein
VHKTLFVCYRHGCRGENLSHRISQHKYFKTLIAEKVNGRTVIKNDHFNKKLLSHRSMVNLSTISLPTQHNTVVPSHFFFDDLHEFFPEAKYLSIEATKDVAQFRQDLYDRYFQYRTKNLLELVGECENKFRIYNKQTKEQELKEFIVKVLKRKNVTFGDILCLAAGVEPNITNKEILIKKEDPKPLSKKTKQNSFVVAYEDVFNVDIQDIIEYMDISNSK